jgi:hypothetical protein
LKRISLDELPTVVGRYARVETGSGASETEVGALERAVGVTFPEDYRTCLRRFGSLSIQGDPDSAPTELRVFGPLELVDVRARFRQTIIEWHGGATWLDQRRELPGPDLFAFFKAPIDQEPPTLDEKRARFCEELEIGLEHVPRFFDDQMDRWRFAYRHLVPVITLGAIRSLPDEEFRYSECVGPGGRIYSVNFKGVVELQKATFTAKLLANVGEIIMAPSMTPPQA